MLVQLAVGAVMLALAVMLHAAVLDRTAVMVRAILAPMETRPPATTRLGILVAAALLAFLSHIVQVWAWAGVYLLAGEFELLEEALYFSTVTFTTLGFGDLTVSADWRLLSSFESAAGLFLFGISTAFVFEVMRIVWQHRAFGED